MSPPTLATIPRELLHQILTYAFEDPSLCDLNLMASMRFCVYKGAADDDGRDMGWATDNGLCFAPHIASRASTLIAGLPDLGEDVKYVLGKVLGELAIKTYVTMVVEGVVLENDPELTSLAEWLSMISARGAWL